MQFSRSYNEVASKDSAGTTQKIACVDKFEQNFQFVYREYLRLSFMILTVLWSDKRILVKQSKANCGEEKTDYKKIHLTTSAFLYTVLREKVITKMNAVSVASSNFSQYE